MTATFVTQVWCGDITGWSTVAVGSVAVCREAERYYSGERVRIISADQSWE